MSQEKFRAISASEFFYRNREIAGFDNPVRATYTVVRELVENSLDSCELFKVQPEVYVRLTYDEDNFLRIRIADNGSGVPREYILSAFGRVLYGSKYTIRQTRGTFGLGGKMAILYGQITTNSPVEIVTSTGGRESYKVGLMIDVEHNEPKKLYFKRVENGRRWHGLALQFKFDGDYVRSKPKVIDYFKQTAIVLPHGNLSFVGPDGVYYSFQAGTDAVPRPPEEVLPHPHGVDVEMLDRLLHAASSNTMQDFLSKHFHRLGQRTAAAFLKRIHIKPNTPPSAITSEQTIKLVNTMKNFDGFLPPDATCLSPIGTQLLEAGIRKELNPELLAVTQRRPSAYSGHPFIVEAAMAYGGSIPQSPPDEVLLFRFANKIPLLYDSHSDVSMKVIRRVKWSNYKLDLQKDPLAFFVHLCSTKIPYKTVGKEYIADQPEVEYEVEWALKNCARMLKRNIIRKEKIEQVKRKTQILEGYLPKIAEFSARLAGDRDVPDVSRLISRADEHG